MTEKSKEDAIREMVDWVATLQNLANFPIDGATPNQPDQLTEQATRCVQLEYQTQQVSANLRVLIKSMSESVVALQDTATSCQQNHLLVLETQLTYLQHLAHDLTVVEQAETTNESE